MADIIAFGDLAKMRETIKAQEAEIATLRETVKELRTFTNNTQGINDILRMQLNDLLVTIEGWRAGMDGIVANVLEMKAKLPK
ncbi:MAG: hypothetical protein EOP84_26265 [Verrucomicrobiaceae bacterium]|nr:MAG: hypothetical protein EOP84_26265 [Verrucomicrobiaceae bacterium]